MTNTLESILCDGASRIDVFLSVFYCLFPTHCTDGRKGCQRCIVRKTVNKRFRYGLSLKISTSSDAVYFNDILLRFFFFFFEISYIKSSGARVVVDAKAIRILSCHESHVPGVFERFPSRNMPPTFGISTNKKVDTALLAAAVRSPFYPYGGE